MVSWVVSWVMCPLGWGVGVEFGLVEFGLVEFGLVEFGLVGVVIVGVVTDLFLGLNTCSG